MERVMGIGPTYPAWKAGVLADVLHPHKGPKSPKERESFLKIKTVIIFFSFSSVWKLYPIILFPVVPILNKTLPIFFKRCRDSFIVANVPTTIILFISTII